MTPLQKELLRVYAVFKKICDSNGLRYFAYAGTAIGAARHKGFIPWDDDIDITMPFPDYMRFQEIINTDKPLGVELYNGLKKPVSDMTFLRLFSTETMFTNYGLIFAPDSFTGVYIDILPIIGLPQGESKRNRFVENLHANLHNLWFNKLFGYDEVYTKKLIKEYDTLVAAYDFDSASYVCGVDRMELNSRRTIYPSQDFSSFIVSKFEDTTINLPAGYHTQLTNKFGDYTRLPNKSERVSHHMSFALFDANTSYKEYQRLFSNPLAKKYLQHVTEYMKMLQHEKFDLLKRIPPLEDRIKLELVRVKQEVSEKERYKTPGVRIAGVLLAKALIRRFRLR